MLIVTINDINTSFTRRNRFPQKTKLSWKKKCMPPLTKTVEVEKKMEDEKHTLFMIKMLCSLFEAGLRWPSWQSTQLSNWRAQIRGSPVKTPPCILMAPSTCKNRRGCNVLQIPIQIIPLWLPKRGSHPLRCGSKLRWHVFGSPIGMNPRPSAIAHWSSSNPTLNPLNLL